MKKMKFLAMLMLALSAGLTFTACSDDDDDEGGSAGNGALTISGGTSKSGLNYGNWYIDSEGTAGLRYHMEFWTFDIYSALTNSDFDAMSRGFSVVYIDLQAPEGTLPTATSLPTGEFDSSEYHVYSAFNVTPSNDEGTNQYEKVYNKRSGDLVIKGGNGNYTISLTDVKMVDNNSGNETFYSGSFLYSGTMRKFNPESLYE